MNDDTPPHIRVTVLQGGPVNAEATSITAQIGNERRTFYQWRDREYCFVQEGIAAPRQNTLEPGTMQELLARVEQDGANPFQQLWRGLLKLTHRERTYTVDPALLSNLCPNPMPKDGIRLAQQLDETGRN